jgi:hypothetical protein
MTSVTTFLLVVIGMALLSGPFYMRMLAHGPKPDIWWRGRRDGSFLFGLLLAVPGLILYLIGGIGPITLAWMLLVCAAFNLSIAATCHVALRRLPPPQDGV